MGDGPFHGGAALAEWGVAGAAGVGQLPVWGFLYEVWMPVPWQPLLHSRLPGLVVACPPLRDAGGVEGAAVVPAAGAAVCDVGKVTGEGGDHLHV